MVLTTHRLLALVAGILVACGGTTTTTGDPPEPTPAPAPSAPPPSDTSCADCGGCGIAGPINADALRPSKAGTTGTGVPTLTLDVEKAGTCRGTPLVGYDLAFADQAVTVTQHDAHVAFGPTTTTESGADGSTVYTWNDRDLRVTISRAAPSVIVTFTAGAAAPVTTTCALSGTRVVCS